MFIYYYAPGAPLFITRDVTRPARSRFLHMIYDLQKADVWKRASAALLDLILTAIVAVGAMLLLTLITDPTTPYQEFNAIMDSYAEKHGVDFSTIETSTEFEALPKAEQDKINEAYMDFARDNDAIYYYNVYVNLIILNTSLGILIAIALMHFVIPLFFKNGQTIGKKVFGLGVMRLDGVQVSGQIMFIRSVLGKYSINTMIPLMMFIWIRFNSAGIMAVIMMALVLFGNIIMMLATRTNSGIHDMLAHTVVVDMASQMIFESPEALLEYKQRVHEEAVQRAEYR